MSNLVEWTRKSIAKHCNSLRQSIDFYVDPDERELTQERERIEFRVDGPLIETHPNNQIHAMISINLLVVTYVVPTNPFRTTTVVDIAKNMFTNSISLYNNSGVKIGCLTRISEIKIHDYSRSKTEREIYTTVESDYEYWSE